MYTEILCKNNKQTLNALKWKDLQDVLLNEKKNPSVKQYISQATILKQALEK